MGTGKCINLWSNYWLPGVKILARYKPTGTVSPKASHVSDIIDQTSHGWNTVVINRLFPPQIGTEIFQLAPPIVPADDAIIWEGEKWGV